MIQTSLKVSGIDHVVLWVRDLARTKKFYTELLGMQVQMESSSLLFLRCGGQGVDLFQVRDGADFPDVGEMNHMALRLDSGTYEEVKATLEAAGLEVSGRPGDPRCLYFNDPDGHRLQLLTPAEWQR